MNDDRIIQYVTHQLNKATRAIDTNTLERLSEFRQTALLSKLPVPVMRLSSHAGLMDMPVHHTSFSFKWATVLLFISACAIGGIHYWPQQTDQDEEIGQLDANLLASDIAPQDLSSQEFGSWLSENP